MNDSAIILKNLIPALAGSDAFDEEWEKKITYSVQPSIEQVVTNNAEDFNRWAADPDGFGIPGPVLWLFGGMIGRMIAGGLPKNPLNVLVDPIVPLKEFATAVGEKTFFGGDEPSPVDISLYGTLVTFVNKSCTTVLGLLDEAALMPWFLAMDAKIPLKSLYPATAWTPPAAIAA